MFGLTTKIRGFVLTRDSYIWFWGKVVGLAGLVVSGAIQPATLGLSDKQARVVMGVCAAVMTISAKLATSPLPSKADAQKVTVVEKTP